MGYRSNVRIATTRAGYERMCRIVDETDAGNEFRLMGAKVAPKHRSSFGGTVVFGWDWIKWDECYPDVSKVVKAQQTIESEGYPVVFARVGEGLDDVEMTEANEGMSELDAYPEPKTEIVTWSCMAELPDWEGSGCGR